MKALQVHARRSHYLWIILTRYRYVVSFLLLSHFNPVHRQAGRVVQQLHSRPAYLFHYLDALFKKDQHLASDFADLQVTLFAEYATSRLIEYLRASSYYNLEGVSASSVIVVRDCQHPIGI